MFDSVVKEYDGLRAVDSVSFKVEPGEIVALLGPNGSGKSTLMKMTVGLVKPDQGRVLVVGVDPARDPLEARRRVGYVPEEDVVFESLRIDEYLEFIASVYGLDPVEARRRAERAIEILGLREHLGKLIGELSHGNQRKVLIAGLMVREPEALVLDEVFTGLDALAARVVKEYVKLEASRGKPVLFSTHVLPIAEAMADRIVIMYRGRVVAEGSPEELKEKARSKELEEVFLEVTGLRGELEEILKVLRG